MRVWLTASKPLQQFHRFEIVLGDFDSWNTQFSLFKYLLQRTSIPNNYFFNNRSKIWKHWEVSVTEISLCSSPTVYARCRLSPLTLRSGLFSISISQNNIEFAHTVCWRYSEEGERDPEREGEAWIPLICHIWWICKWQILNGKHWWIAFACFYWKAGWVHLW